MRGLWPTPANVAEKFGIERNPSGIHHSVVPARATGSSTGVRALGAVVLAWAVSCAVPDYTFSGDSPDGGAGVGGTEASGGASGEGAGGETPTSHCDNGVVDTDEGETDVDCGGECRRCSLLGRCRAEDGCEEGDCIEGVCQKPDCDDGVKDLKETAVDCGGGDCRPCAAGEACRQARDCESGVCGDDETCSPAACDDGVTNGDETARDCGGTRCPGCKTGDACEKNGDCASAHCGDGRCQVSCLPGTAECDGDLAEECETNTLTDPDHCGGCGMRCNLAHGAASCVGGTCQVSSCDSPYEDCDRDPTNGCEVNLGKDADNCSACGAACPAINGVPSCEGSRCLIECEPGFADCDDDRGNGCEKRVAADAQNCGECRNACTANAGETPFCLDGTCGSTTCEAGLGNCNGDPMDGCEQPLDDVDNCGACGSRCVAAHGVAACSAGKCIVESCDAGFGNCNTGDADGGYSDGCETNTNASLSHCGACGAACSITHATARCESGQCRVGSCTVPYQDCDMDGTSCETDTSTSVMNCGGCGMAGLRCDTQFAHATGKCVASTCQLGSCDQSFGDCDGGAQNGCETALSSDELHCGSCTTQCLAVGGTNTCTSGACMPSCDATHLSCNASTSDGCEVDRTTAAHCGTCANSCGGAAPYCVNGACASMPATICGLPGWAFCDDFQDGNANGWSPTAGSWSVVTDSSLVYRYAGESGSQRSVVGSGSWTDQTIVAKVKVLHFDGSSSSYRAGILGRYAGSTNYYALMLDGTGALTLRRGTSSISGSGCGSVSPSPSLSGGGFFWLELQISGPASSTRLVSSYSTNGTSFSAAHNCTVSGGTLGGGNTGVLTVGQNTSTEFDDFAVSTP